MTREALEKYFRQITVSPSVDFCDSLLRGAGQLFLCNNPVSGIFFICALMLLYPRETLLGLAGLLSATLICHIIYEKYWIVKNGIAGSNGFLIGLLFLLFPDLPLLNSLALVIAGAFLSSLIIFKIYKWLGDYTRLQILSFPSVAVSYLICGLIYTSSMSSPMSVGGWVDYMKGSYSKSAEKFVQAVTAVPDQLYAHEGLGWSYYRLNQHSFALREFSTVLDRKPDFFDAWIGTGWCSFRMGNYERAQASFSRALQFNSEAGDAYLGLGWIYLTKSENDNAYSFFRRALSSRGSLSDAYIGLAWCHMNKKEYSRARSMLNKAHFFDPSSRDAEDAMEYLQTLEPAVERKKPAPLMITEDLLPLFRRFLLPITLPFLLIFAGIALHSRTSAKYALIGLAASLAFIMMRRHYPEFGSTFFVYNCITVAIAFGGLQFLQSRSSKVMTVLAIIVSAWFWLIMDRGFTPLGFPPLSAPFALTVFLFTFPYFSDVVKDGTLGLRMVGFDMISTSPEQVLQWKRFHDLSRACWDKIKALEGDD